MTDRRTTPAFVLLTLLTSLVALGCSGSAVPTPVEGKPLLSTGLEERPVFRDEQLGLQFHPPGNWSMQVRSRLAPDDKGKDERVVVKYKRLLEGLHPAWLKVSVVENEATPLAELIAPRKPEPSWRQLGEVEHLTLQSRPAARITFGGTLAEDGGKAEEARTEVVAVRRDRHVFFFTGTYFVADPKGQKRIRTAVESVRFFTDRDPAVDF
jgi:hypothetical protein